MRRIRGCFAVLCCLAATVGISAQEKKPISAMPADGFQFAGTWDCEGMFRNAQAHKAVFTGTTILDGKWLELTEEDVQPSTGYKAKYLIGYDSEQKTLVEFDANNFGAAIYASREGWQNRVLTMSSPISQDPKASYAANRFLYSVTGQDAFTVDWQISKTSTLSWIQADHLACKRRS
jgi:hypothetical protein